MIAGMFWSGAIIDESIAPGADKPGSIAFIIVALKPLSAVQRATQRAESSLPRPPD
jgi:hypothetical protein